MAETTARPKVKLYMDGVTMDSSGNPLENLNNGNGYNIELENHIKTRKQKIAAKHRINNIQRENERPGPETLDSWHPKFTTGNRGFNPGPRYMGHTLFFNVNKPMPKAPNAPSTKNNPPVKPGAMRAAAVLAARAARDKLLANHKMIPPAVPKNSSSAKKKSDGGSRKTRKSKKSRKSKKTRRII
jgi:hypothetical protein